MMTQQIRFFAKEKVAQLGILREAVQQHGPGGFRQGAVPQKAASRRVGPTVELNGRPDGRIIQCVVLAES